MKLCPFCKKTPSENNTFCKVCGYSFVLALPILVLPHKKLDLSLACASIIFGILACIFSWFPPLYLISFVLVILAIALAGVTLESVSGKFNTLLIKILAIVGLVFGTLGYICFMFLCSHVPGIHG
ncbi:MAG: hypothetical protein AMJ89_06865 [candidate division Zixibacteria bacterium SM23_73]|nr:MAG: hypothetical protein AMJ89_06865 [candidate division Zixibacteria bacterium SM23_73]